MLIQRPASQVPRACSVAQKTVWWGLMASAALMPLGTSPAFLATGHSGSSAMHSLEAYAQRPLAFEANRGQSDAEVRFISHGGGYRLFLTSTEAVLSLHQPVTQNGKTMGRTTRATDPGQINGGVLRLKLVGAKAMPQITGVDELPGKANYFIGNDPASWRTDIRTYARVTYRDVYPGVDMAYYGNERQLEYDLIVAPGTDPGAIALRIEGSTKMGLDPRGDLVLDVDGHAVVMRRPHAYQELNGARQAVRASYTLSRERQIGFRVGDYDTTRPLVIDPVLVYSTYLGGSGADLANRIAVDGSGNAYVTGWINSTNFPSSNAVQPVYGGGSYDAFVTKLNAAGAVMYSTYVGGNAWDSAFGIAVDGSGSAYITGYTASANFPLSGGPVVSPLKATLSGAVDVFVTKLNPAGNGLVYSLYLGGSQDDEGIGIVVNSGNAYIVGATDSVDFPIAGGPVVSPLQAAHSGVRDAFVAKLNPAGTTLIYSTFLGGNGFDTAYAVAVDPSGNAYVAGYTASTNFPTVGAYDATYNGGNYDAFVAKINAAGKALLYSTYLGGNGTDIALDIALDASGKAYVTGQTGSSNFPTKNPLQAALGGITDAFVAKIDAAQTGSASLVYSTFFGGSGHEYGYGIAVDNVGNAWITGVTLSTNLPTLNPIQPSLNGSSDVFVAAIGPPGSPLVFSTYLGGAGDDWGQSIALDGAGNAYVTGYTTSTDFPTVNPAQSANAGGVRDGFVVKLSSLIPIPSCVDPPTTTMVAWYPFDETSGTTAANLATGNAGTLVNGPTHVPGKVAGALRFDGVNDYVQSPSTLVTNIGSAGLPQTCSGSYSTCRGDFSIDAWINLDPTASLGVSTIVDKRIGTAPAIRGYSFFVFSRNRLGIQLADGVGTGYTNYLGPVIAGGFPGSWHHVAVTVSRRSSPAGIKWYDHGVLIGSNDPTTGATRYGSLANASPLRIGGDNYTAGWFKGDIDEVEIFNRELTTAEVQGIYNAGATGKCK